MDEDDSPETLIRAGRTFARIPTSGPTGPQFVPNANYTFTQVLTPTIMTEETNVVAICPDHDAAEQGGFEAPRRLVRCD